MGKALGAILRPARTLGLAALVATLLSMWLFAPGHAAGPQAFYGMVVEPDVDIGKAIPRLGELGVHTVRLRMDVKDWAQPTANTGAKVYDGALDQAPRLKGQGFQVVLLVNSEGGAMPSYPRARALFEWLLDRPGANSVDVFEVLGPVTEHDSNADAYSLTLSLGEQAHRYVNGPLKAAADVFHPARRKVLGGAFTPRQQKTNFDVRGGASNAVTAAYLKAGYLDQVDYAGLRPTLSTPAAQADWVRRVVPQFGRKPIWVSEWGLDRNSYPDPTRYAQAMDQAVKGLRPLVAVACYQGFTLSEDSYGVVERNLGYPPADPAFSIYRSWPKT
jgi:hypothetical protein